MPFPPFILGLLIGGGAVIAFNKRKKIASALCKENLEDALCKTKGFATDVKDSIVTTTESMVEKTKATLNQIKTTQSNDENSCTTPPHDSKEKTC